MPTLEEYKSFLSILRKQTGLDALTPDDGGLVTFRVEDTYIVNLQFVEPSGKILCFIEVTKLPQDAPKDVYRDLLGGALFGKETAGGFFALEPESETVVYNYLFDFDKAAASPEQFIETLEKILQLIEVWAERIQNHLAGSDNDDAIPSSMQNQIFFQP